MRKLVAVCSLVLLVSVCGCAHYRTPGGGVSLPAITDANVAEALARKPAAQFPAHVVVARVASEKSRIVTTCAAAFIDVRTGYVYGVAEGSATDTRRSSVWTTEAAIETARLKTEREAFSGALKEIAKAWTAINAEYNVAGAAVAGGPP